MAQAACDTGCDSDSGRDRRFSKPNGSCVAAPVCDDFGADSGALSTLERFKAKLAERYPERLHDWLTARPPRRQRKPVKKPEPPKRARGIAKIEPDQIRNHVRMSPRGCWLWKDTRNNHGYGVVNDNGRQRLVHRAVYERYVGPIPDGLWVLHHCDNPRCCNPEHLTAGTPALNNQHMVERDRCRPRRGERVWTAKLNRYDVKAIRRSTESNAALAAKYGVTAVTIGKIRARASWKHLGDE